MTFRDLFSDLIFSYPIKLVKITYLSQIFYCVVLIGFVSLYFRFSVFVFYLLFNRFGCIFRVYVLTNVVYFSLKEYKQTKKR